LPKLWTFKKQQCTVAVLCEITNLSPYNPVVREIMKDFKPTHIPAKIVISIAVTITYYIKVRITDTSELNIVITN
jgi:hypothetical protein